MIPSSSIPSVTPISADHPVSTQLPSRPASDQLYPSRYIRSATKRQYVEVTSDAEDEECSGSKGGDNRVSSVGYGQQYQQNGCRRRSKPNGAAPNKRMTRCRSACTHCKKAGRKCSENRPCERCTIRGYEDCHDAPRLRGHGSHKSRRSGSKGKRGSNLSLAIVEEEAEEVDKRDWDAFPRREATDDESLVSSKVWRSTSTSSISSSTIRAGMSPTPSQFASSPPLDSMALPRFREPGPDSICLPPLIIPSCSSSIQTYTTSIPSATSTPKLPSIRSLFTSIDEDFYLRLQKERTASAASESSVGSRFVTSFERAYSF